MSEAEPMLVMRDDFSAFAGRSVLTIGKFDGLHLGHQHLFAMVQRRATEHGAQAVVVTFDPHPAAVLGKQGAPALMTPLPEKLALLEGMGVDAVALISFTRDFAAMRAHDFLVWLARDLRPLEIWVGANFAFGARREGTVETLRAWGEANGVGVQVIDPVLAGEAWISGSNLRSLLAEGDVETVAAQLGRPYTLTGTVIQGDQRGRSLGFPTANMALLPEKAVPAHGVYLTLAQVAGERFPAITNVGVRPTVDGSRRLVETHLLDWQGDLYGQQMTVHFLQRVRGEQKFSGLEALVAQVHHDIAQARQWFAEHVEKEGGA